MILTIALLLFLVFANYFLGKVVKDVLLSLGTPKFMYKVVLPGNLLIYKIVLLFLSFQYNFPKTFGYNLILTINVELFILFFHNLIFKSSKSIDYYFIFIASCLMLISFFLTKSFDAITALLLFSLAIIYHFESYKLERKILYKKLIESKIFLGPLAVIVIIISTYILSLNFLQSNFFIQFSILFFPDLAIFKIDKELLKNIILFNMLFVTGLLSFFSIYLIEEFFFLLLSNFLVSLSLIIITKAKL